MENYSSIQVNILFVVEIISCIATCAAIFVALWQTKYPFRKKFKIDIKKIKSIMHGTERIKINDTIYNFCVFNHGNIDVKVNSFGIMDSKNRMILSLRNSYIKIDKETLTNSESIPSYLAVQSSFSVLYSLDAIIKYIESSQYTTKKDCNQLKIFIKDGQGKIYRKKIKKMKYKEIYNSIKNSKLRLNDSTIIYDDNTQRKILNITVKWYDDKQNIGYGKCKKINYDIFFRKEQILGNANYVYEGDKINIVLDANNDK